MIKTAAVFSDNMVLQRNKLIRIFGTTDSTAEATCTFAGKIYKADIADNRFTFTLNPIPAGGPYDLEIKQGDDVITYTNIMVGEVWLAGGQSNMELEIQNEVNGKAFLETYNNPKVRYYYTPKVGHLGEELDKAERESAWTIASPENAKAWSAVAVYFAEILSEKLDVTIGILGCNWGGTSASAWQSRESLLSHQDTAIYINEYDELTAGKTEEEMIKEYEAYLEYDRQWFIRSQELAKVEPGAEWSRVLEVCGENKYPGPQGCINPMRPTGLYETMVSRVAPYTLGGVIYYQGESDDHRPNSYYRLLVSLVEQWRNDFKDTTLPFLTVQLPMHTYQGSPDSKSWAIIRHAQQKLSRTIKNTSTAIVIDCGEINNIHPVNKRPVGERLAWKALNDVYGIDSSDRFSPEVIAINFDKDTIKLTFNHVDGGIVVKEGPHNFEIAGFDGEFVTADIEVNGAEIILKSDKLENPRYVRYLWTNYAEVTLFNKAGYPIAPFNTQLD